MELVPERSRSLHNFPCFNLKWGRQKQLRCVKNAADQVFPTASSSLRRRSASFEEDGGIEAVREKLLLDLRAEVHQMKAAILSADGGGNSPVPESEVKPWNLRTRRAVCKEPNNGGASSPARRRRSGEIVAGGDDDVGPRVKFSSSLSKREIDEDFVAITGTRPARRPKKRPKHLQKEIDALFPGFWLSEVTAEMYKVNENHEAGKR